MCSLICVECLVGDLHGDLAKARCALEIAGVLSSDGRDMWTGGETVLINRRKWNLCIYALFLFESFAVTVKLIQL